MHVRAYRCVLLAITGVLLGVGAACVKSVPYVPNHRALGVTFCATDKFKNGGESHYPVVWINGNVVGGPDQEWVLRHELKHAEQVRRLGNCVLWKVYLSQNLGDLEAEAFCEAVKYEVEINRMSYDAALDKYARWLSRYPGQSPEGSITLMKKYC